MIYTSNLSLTLYYTSITMHYVSTYTLQGLYTFRILLEVFKKDVDGTKNVSKVIFTLIHELCTFYLCFHNYFKVKKNKRTVAAKGLPEIQKMAQFSENLAGSLID